eukprot:2954330-Amphidinium_carterae.1
MRAHPTFALARAITRALRAETQRVEAIWYSNKKDTCSWTGAELNLLSECIISLVFCGERLGKPRKQLLQYKSLVLCTTTSMSRDAKAGHDTRCEAAKAKGGHEKARDDMAHVGAIYLDGFGGRSKEWCVDEEAYGAAA